MAERKIVRIEVTEAAKSALEKLCERYGMTQQAAQSRIYEWFCDQPEELQVIVLGLAPTGRDRALAEVFLQLIAKGRSRPHPRLVAKKSTGVIKNRGDETEGSS